MEYLDINDETLWIIVYTVVGLLLGAFSIWKLLYPIGYTDKYRVDNKPEYKGDSYPYELKQKYRIGVFTQWVKIDEYKTQESAFEAMANFKAQNYNLTVYKDK